MASNWDDFEKTYREDFGKDDVYLGYYCHLIQEAVWFHDIDIFGFIQKKLRY